MDAPRIGIVLSSGGGRGIYAHTGFLLALEKLQISIKAVAGCSAGAIVGGIFASGARLDDWSQAITQLETKQFWTPRPLWQLLYQLVIKKGQGLLGVSDAAAAMRFLSRQLAVKTFKACRYPFHVSTVNLGSGRKALLSEGELAHAMMASAAMPFLYEPINIDGEYYTDGAIIDLSPTDAICCRHQLDTLIVHHVAQRDYTSAGLKHALTRRWSVIEVARRIVYRETPWYATGEPTSMHKCPCDCGANILVLEPRLPDLVWPITEEGKPILEAARKQAKDQLGQRMDLIQQFRKDSSVKVSQKPAADSHCE